MLKIHEQYPGAATDPTAAYPAGSAKNETSAGAQDGTPWELAIINDMLGAMQAAVYGAGGAASGSAETATSSQVLQGIITQVTNSLGTAATRSVTGPGDLMAKGFAGIGGQFSLTSSIPGTSVKYQDATPQQLIDNGIKGTLFGRTNGASDVPPGVSPGAGLMAINIHFDSPSGAYAMYKVMFVGLEGVYLQRAVSTLSSWEPWRKFSMSDDLGTAATRDATGAGDLMAEGFAGIGGYFNMRDEDIPSTSIKYQDATPAELESNNVTGFFCGRCDTGTMRDHPWGTTRGTAVMIILNTFNFFTCKIRFFLDRSGDVFSQISLSDLSGWGPWQLISNSVPVYYDTSTTTTLQPGTYEVEVAGPGGGGASSTGDGGVGHPSYFRNTSRTIDLRGGGGSGGLINPTYVTTDGDGYAVGSATKSYSARKGAGGKGGGVAAGITNPHGGFGGLVVATIEIDSTESVEIIVGAGGAGHTHTTTDRGFEGSDGWVKIQRIK